MGEKYKIVRMFYRDDCRNRVVARGMTLEEAQEHCRNPETSSKTCQSSARRRYTEINGPWFDGYELE